MSNNEQEFQTESAVYGLSEMKWKRRSGSANAENANVNSENGALHNKPSGTDPTSSTQLAADLFDTSRNLNTEVRSEQQNETGSKCSAPSKNRSCNSTIEGEEEISNVNKLQKILDNGDNKKLCTKTSYKMQLNEQNMSFNEPESKRNSNYLNRNETYRDRNNDHPRKSYRSEKENVNYDRWQEQDEMLPKQFFKKIPLGSKYHREFYLTRKEFEIQKRIIEKKKNPFIPNEKPLNSAKSFSLEVFDVRLVDKIKSNENGKDSVEINSNLQNLVNKTAMLNSSTRISNGNDLNTKSNPESETFIPELSSLNINATPFCPNTSSCNEKNNVSEFSSHFHEKMLEDSKQFGNDSRTTREEFNNATVKTKKGYHLNRGFKKLPADPRINQDLIHTLNELDARRLRNVPNMGITEELTPITSTVVNASPVILNNIPQPLVPDVMIPVVISASKLANLREYFPEATSFLFSTTQNDVAPAMLNTPKPLEIVPQEYAVNTAPAVIDECAVDDLRCTGQADVPNCVTPVSISSIAAVNQSNEASETLSCKFNANMPPPRIPPIPAVISRNPYQAVKPLMQSRSNFSSQATYVSIPNLVSNCNTQTDSIPTPLIAQSFPNQLTVTNTDLAVSNYSLPNGNSSTSLMTQSLPNQSMVSTAFENRPMFSEQVRITSDQPDSITINIDNYP